MFILSVYVVEYGNYVPLLVCIYNIDIFSYGAGEYVNKRKEIFLLCKQHAGYTMHVVVWLAGGSYDSMSISGGCSYKMISHSNQKTS